MQKLYCATVFFLISIILCCLFKPVHSIVEGLESNSPDGYPDPSLSAQTNTASQDPLIERDLNQRSDPQPDPNPLLPGTPTPAGIPASQIPPGSEDMYILKSQVVPPVCPACPTTSGCPRDEPCPPCPPCARCPETPFSCVKVPNYSAIDSQFLPKPLLNNFSQFGS